MMKTKKKRTKDISLFIDLKKRAPVPGALFYFERVTVEEDFVSPFTSTDLT
jgi:hypothetical protein